MALNAALGVPAHLSGEGPPAVSKSGSGAAAVSLQRTMIEQREALTDAFKRRQNVPILVTTEYSVRGVDLKAIDVVFMLGLPARQDSYVHVAGRTAREGRKGRAVRVLSFSMPCMPTFGLCALHLLHARRYVRRCMHGDTSVAPVYLTLHVPVTVRYEAHTGVGGH